MVCTYWKVVSTLNDIPTLLLEIFGAQQKQYVCVYIYETQQPCHTNVWIPLCDIFIRRIHTTRYE